MNLKPISTLLLSVLTFAASPLWAQPAPTPSVAPKSGEIKPYQGRPTIHVNGTPMTPDIYALTHATGARWSWEEVPQHNVQNFYNIGFRLFQLDFWLSEIWPKNGEPLNVSLAQKQIRGVLDVAPEACIILRVHTDAPYWWNEQHREECTEYADGPIQEYYKPGMPHNNEDFSIMRSLRASLASQHWKQEAGDLLTQFCKQLSQTPEGNAVIGMHLAGGIYGEWHYWGFVDHEPDTGPAMTAYFRNWLKNKYGTDKKLQQAWKSKQWTLTTATVPGVEERKATQFGQFKDPQQEQRVIDYIAAQQEAVVEDIEYFCQLAKENWPRPLITGVFYGYLHMTFNRQSVGGHLLVERILDCPWIDYIAAPQTYYKASRKLGGSGMPRGIVESAALHGKLWFDEMDNGELARRVCHDAVRYLERYDRDYAPVLRRSVVLPLMRGGVWYYDFGIRESLGWFDDPVYLQSIADEKALFDKQLHKPYHSEADVLYVWSQESYYYLAPHGTPISSNVVDQTIEEALRSGTVGDHIYDFDLDKVNLDQYKAIIFMNSYALSPAQQKFIREKVAKNGRTLIYNYMTGVTDGKQIGLSQTEKLSGVELALQEETQPQTVTYLTPASEYTFKGVVEPFAIVTDPKVQPLATLKDHPEKVVLARKQFPTHTAVYATLPINGTDVFRQLFRKAGCHVYNDQNDFTYVNSGIMLIHTLEGGPRTIHLRNGKDLQLELPAKSNAVLDASTGEPLLKEIPKTYPNAK